MVSGDAQTADRRLPDPVSEPTITVERAAVILGISRASAYEAVRDGVIPSIRIRRRILVPTAALQHRLNTGWPIAMRLDVSPAALRNAK